MTDISNKKLGKLKQKIYDFLERHRYSDESKEKHTHLSYGMFAGKFVLDKNQRKEFMKLY